MSEQNEVAEIIASKVEGFGYRLMSAREQKKLSISDVAADLRLDERIVRALEQQDYNQLPQPAYVCGYIRNYAKMLGIFPEPLVESYKKEIEENLTPKLRATGQVRRPEPNSIKRLLVLLLVLVFSIAGIAGWQLWQYHQNNNTATAETETDNESLQISDDPTKLGLPEPDNLLSADSNNSAIQKNSGSEPEPQEAELLQTEAETPPAVPVTAEEDAIEAGAATNDESMPGPATAAGVQYEADNTASTAAETVAGNQAVAEIVEPVTAETTSSPVPVALERDTLVLDFSGQSWISITDADGKKLSKGLIGQGRHLELKGAKPYHVFLGDATVVTVSINGVVYDHSSYINEKKVARFKVE